jgi:hypothetical protein
LIKINLNNGIHLAPQQETLFIGGIAQEAGKSEYSGKTASRSDGHFYSMVIDHKPTGVSERSCLVLISALHELGHGLQNNSKLNGANFKNYGLDEHGHDPAGIDAVMIPGVMCTTSFNFSDASAKLISEHLHPNVVLPDKLTNISSRCAVQLGRITKVNP